MQIIVASCGAYSDAWAPFYALFQKFWPDCPWPLTLVTDAHANLWPGEKSIEIGCDLGWGPNIVVGLRKLNNPRHFLLLQEDFFLSQPVNNNMVQEALAMMSATSGAGCFRLFPCPGPDAPLTDWYGLIKHQAAYRVSCQAAIWFRPEFESLAFDCRTAADFEIQGTLRASKRCACVKYYSVLRNDPNTWPINYYCSAIARGQWMPEAVEFVKAQGIPIDTSKRPIMGCPR